MNKVTHFEIVVTDPERAIAFYSKVFGWKFEKWEESPIDYWMVLTTPAGTPGAINGGLRKEMGTDFKEKTVSVNAFVCTIEVASIDDALKAVGESGGATMQQKTEVQGLGFIASCLDTEGNMFSMRESA